MDRQRSVRREGHVNLNTELWDDESSLIYLAEPSPDLYNFQEDTKGRATFIHLTEV